MGIGKYERGKGWVPYQEFDDPPQPRDVFTIYTMDGNVGEVTNIEPHRFDPRSTPVEWEADITPWYREGSGEPYALAILGHSPVAADPARTLSPQEPELIARLVAYLRKRRLDVPTPNVTQAFEVTLSARGPKAILVCAHSDESALRDDMPAAVYALALLEIYEGGTWKDFPLAKETSYKPASRSIEDHERLNGQRNFYRFLSCLDIDGDGWKEIVLYDSKPGFGTQIEVHSYNGRRTKCLLSAFKHLYN